MKMKVGKKKKKWAGDDPWSKNLEEREESRKEHGWRSWPETEEKCFIF